MPNRCWTRLVVVAMLICGSDAEAQLPTSSGSAAPLDRIEVPILLANTAGFDNQAVVQRQRKADGGDQIVLPIGSATPEMLAAGVITLASLMEREGDSAGEPSITVVPTLQNIPPNELKAARRVLQNLVKAKRSSHPQFGETRLVSIWVPSATERDRIRARTGRPARP